MAKQELVVFMLLEQVKGKVLRMLVSLMIFTHIMKSQLVLIEREFDWVSQSGNVTCFGWWTWRRPGLFFCFCFLGFVLTKILGYILTEDLEKAPVVSCIWVVVRKNEVIQFTIQRENEYWISKKVLLNFCFFGICIVVTLGSSKPLVTSSSQYKIFVSVYRHLSILLTHSQWTHGQAQVLTCA